MISLELKIEDAMHRIKDLYNKTNGKCCLSFSGGKDSTVVAELILMAQKKYNLPDIPFVFADTKVEYNSIYDFIEWYDKNKHPITKLHPAKAFGRVLKEYGLPFGSKIKSQFISSYQNNKSYDFYMQKNSLLGLPYFVNGRLVIPNTPKNYNHLWERFLISKNIYKSIGELIYGNMAKKINKKDYHGNPFKHYYLLNKTTLTLPDSKKLFNKNAIKAIKRKRANSRERLANKHMHVLHPDHEYKISSMCCHFVKKQPFYDYYKDNNILGYFTGIRAEEGGVRTLQYQTCTSSKMVNGIKMWNKMPIFDWTDDDIDNFIKGYNVKISEAYTKYGLKRTGCIGCPFAKDIDGNLKVLYKHEPNKYRACMGWLEQVYLDLELELPFDKRYMEKLKERKEVINKRRYEMLCMFRPEIANKWHDSSCLSRNKKAIYRF